MRCDLRVVSLSEGRPSAYEEHVPGRGPAVGGELYQGRRAKARDVDPTPVTAHLPEGMWGGRTPGDEVCGCRLSSAGALAVSEALVDIRYLPGCEFEEAHDGSDPLPEQHLHLGDEDGLAESFELGILWV